MKISQIQLAVGAIKDDFGLVVAVRGILGSQLKSRSMGRGHAVLGRVFGPIAARTDAIISWSVAAWLFGRILGECRCAQRKQAHETKYPKKL